MLTRDTFTLLKKTPPFTCLDDAVLDRIVREMLVDFYPRGRTILRQNGPAAEHLSIIRNGAVRIFVTTNEGDEVLAGSRTSGDFFGMISFLYGSSMETVVATEDTSCCLIEKETILDLLRTNAEFSGFCLRYILKRLVAMTYKDIRDRTLLSGGGDKLLFTNILSDLAVRNVVTAPEDITIRQAAETMAANAISSLVLLDPSGLPSGMITDRDLRNKVVAKGRDTGGRVGDIMSVTIIKSEAGDYCFEALLKMIRYNIHHVLVVNKGELAGILTNHDLMMLQGTSPLAVAREIENQSTVDGLVPASGKIDKTVSILIKEGAKAGNITRIITEVNDRLLRKILEITEARRGPPPVPYCWIVFGSEGRKEQTFRTDQDNAIIYEDREGSREEAEHYFSGFAADMKDALARCGFPPCKAGYMADNPQWRQPISVWKRCFSNWINQPTPEAVLRSLIFFDFRAVHGDVLLAEKLRAFLGNEIRDKTLFLAHVAATMARNRPPLGFLGNFRCQAKGARKGTFDIKINGVGPIIDAARLAAFEMRIFHTSTRERFIELNGRKGSVLGEWIQDLGQAFEFLMSLRLRRQLQQIQEGEEPDNFIDPGELGRMEKRTLKEAFKIIAAVQDAAVKKYSAYPGM